MKESTIPDARVGFLNRPFWRRLKRERYFHYFVWLGLVFLLIFKFIPMFGIIIAFKDYKITSGVVGFITSPWVGLKYFTEFVTAYNFGTLVRNTLAISLLKLFFAFPIPIIFALMLNEVKNVIFKKFVQTASYLPHFISWVVVTGVFTQLLSENTGVVNDLLLSTGIIDKPLRLLTDPDAFWGLAVITAVWKEAGWWTIIFLASIAGIDPSLYEAAQIDGASRLRRMWHITLPGIKGSVVVVAILALGSLLGGGLIGSNFEQSMLLGNALNHEKSNIIQVYAFKTGLVEGRYAFATAVDLIQSIISLILVLSSNYIARKISGSSLW